MSSTGHPAFQHSSTQQLSEASNQQLHQVRINAWLSVPFGALAAGPFRAMKGGGSQPAAEFHRANLKFTLIRLGVGSMILVPRLRSVTAFVFAPAFLLLQLHAALCAPAQIAQGRRYVFPLNRKLPRFSGHDRYALAAQAETTAAAGT